MKKDGVRIRRKGKVGGEGHRSPYLSHAKRALYHLSYTPFLLILSFYTLSLLANTIPELCSIDIILPLWGYSSIIHFYVNSFI